MTVLEINSCNYGSTGNIMLGIAALARAHGITCYTSCPDGRSTRKKQLTDHIFIGNRFSRNLHIKLAELTGKNGCYSFIDTICFLRKIDKIKPNIIHLHNLHNCYINLQMLFNYIKSKKIPVVWTLHDCWAFTGQCPYFTIVKCNKWRTECYDCPQYRQYPKSYVDRTKIMYNLKKEWFTGVQNMTIVTPSQWLAELVEQSFLKNYQVKVINNGINLNVFKPTKNNFREAHSIGKDEYMLLGVAFGWDRRKGLDVFIELSKRLPKQYKIVLVGTDVNVDKRLPWNITSIHRTQNQKELAEIYTAADLFVNPTREENFPTVNMEALACGTPIITFNTGGSSEIINETCGHVVVSGDIDAMEKEIYGICNQHFFNSEACLKHANNYWENDRFAEYIDLYKNNDL